MLMRTDPFRELDRLTQQVLGNAAGTWSRPTAMAMDAWRAGDTFVVAFDLPGVDPQAIELDVERNVLTVKAERRPVETGEHVEMQVAERPLGVFSRQLFLGETLDPDRIDAELRGWGVDPAHPDRGEGQATQDLDQRERTEPGQADRRLTASVVLDLRAP